MQGKSLSEATFNMRFAFFMFLNLIASTNSTNQTHYRDTPNHFDVYDFGHLDHRPYFITEDTQGFEIMWLDFTILIDEGAPDYVYDGMEKWPFDYYKQHSKQVVVRDCRVFEDKTLGRYICSQKNPSKITKDLYHKFHGLIRAAQFSRRLYQLISSACTVFEGERLCVSWTKNTESELSPAEYGQIITDCRSCLSEGESCRYWVKTHRQTEVFCVSSKAHGCSPRVVC